MFSNFRGAAALAGVLLTAFAGTACAQVQSRGELLYSTHCISCHTSEIHWRDKKAATDWASLRFEVRRWQGTAGLGWSDGDIDDVTRYLNESIYRYAPSTNSMTRDMPPNTGAPVRGAGLVQRDPTRQGSSTGVC
jgi:hypothetical protein